MKVPFISFALALLLSSTFVHAQSPVGMDIVSIYREKIQVGISGSSVPTVLEAILPTGNVERRQYLVLENGTNRFVPSMFREQYEVNPLPITASAEEGVADIFRLVDGNFTQGPRFELPEEGEGVVSINLSAPQPFLSSGLTVVLGQNVSRPTSIEIRASNPGEPARTVLARTSMSGSHIAFLPTRARNWTIIFTHVQPLQINELTLRQDEAEQTVQRTIRFLTQPNMTYTIYQNPDRRDSNYYGETGNLSDNEGVIKTVVGAAMPNERFMPADQDGDGVLDINDNCVSVPNFDQLDIDRNSRGDACEDFDRDGIMNNVDNCPNLPNWDQRDEDSDGIGDVCDEEESRITEQHKWVPWAGMGIAAVVLIGLFGFVAMQKPQRKEETQESRDEMRPPEGQ